jgi:regulator of sigma D
MLSIDTNKFIQTQQHLAEIGQRLVARFAVVT